mmetsp:Transcript_37440/g.61261  ORF Transcript_37440/g.61261 Transcript_37440/m.61261 type:complete len:119 (+) Transcript_37440:212-568(+)
MLIIINALVITAGTEVFFVLLREVRAAAPCAVRLTATLAGCHAPKTHRAVTVATLDDVSQEHFTYTYPALKAHCGLCGRPLCGSRLPGRPCPEKVESVDLRPAAVVAVRLAWSHSLQR